MSRPALSATRAFDIVELLATFPERRFTLSEIVKATQINIASCHAILNALTTKGYLVRSETHRTYQLGPSLIAVGKAAQKGLPLVTRAERAAERLFDELGLPVLLSTIVGDELLAVLALENAAGHDTGMRVGERLPLIAPLGVPFLAWASEAEVEEWMERRSTPLDQELRNQLYRDLELTREQGYHVSMRSPIRQTIGSLMAEMARSRSLTDYKEQLSSVIYSFDHQMCRPVEFVEDELYDVHLIAAPIFDQTGNVAFNLAIGGFPQQLTGAALQNYAERLTRTCLEIMREDRAQAGVRATA